MGTNEGEWMFRFCIDYIYRVRPCRPLPEKVVEEKEQSETDFFFAARVSRPLTFVQG